MSFRYLDNAATTPVRREVLEAMTPYLTSHFGNPSSHHSVGEHAARALADARARVAAVLGMRPSDVIFTSGATDANNLAIKGVSIAAQQRRRINAIGEHFLLHSTARQMHLEHLRVLLVPRWNIIPAGATATTATATRISVRASKR